LQTCTIAESLIWRVFLQTTTSKSLSTYADSLQASGRYTFSRDEALAALQATEKAFKSSAHRLVTKGRLVSPRRGFFVIVPIEYSSAGAPPPSWFIDDLMRFVGHDYYVGLLSAAALHGAAHHQPQEFQVVSRVPHRPAEAGRARLRFFTKKHIERAATESMKTDSGSMIVATAETTALDLIRYHESVGYLGNVATVLADLAERLDPTRLVAAVDADAETSVVQRLGYILEQLGAEHLCASLETWLSSQKPYPVPLRADRRRPDAPRNKRWQILVNEEIEADL
jgi:predicted transcriptional regulator of viral defense system